MTVHSDHTNLYGYAQNQVRLWKFMADKLNEQVPVMLLYVLESSGSSPGRQGFKMAVSANKEFYGSIGGGIMEHKFVEMALQKLHQEDEGGVYQQIHDKSASRNQSGMICSGEQTIYLHRLTQADLPAILQIIGCWSSGSSGAMVLDEQGLQFSDQPSELDFTLHKTGEDTFHLSERLGFRNRLYIIGGGHCSRALSKLMSDMDFYITVIDERSGLNTMEENVFAHQRMIIPSYTELADVVMDGNRSYVVIMTFGYRTDDQALRALISRRYRYLGMLGSKKKTAQLMDLYKLEGIHEQLQQPVHSPVGLQIKSETPEEIAISIAAEIISVKNKA